MHLNLLEIFDLLSFNEMLKSFYDLTQISYSIIDNKGKTIFAGEWQNICVDFHRANKDSTKFCEEAEYEGIRFSKSSSAAVQKCKNGFSYIFIPITVNGKNLAYLALTQFLFDKADKEFFIKQAKKYGYDTDMYLDALKRVPVISKKEFYKHVKYFQSTIKMISKLLEKQMEQQKTEDLLIKKKNLLQQEVDNQTRKLKEMNEVLRKTHEDHYHILDGMPIGVVVSKWYKIIFINKEAAKIFADESPKLMINKSILEFVDSRSEGKQTLKKYLNSSYFSNNLVSFREKFIRKKDGKILNVEIATTTTEYGGEEVVLTVIQDISERERLEILNKKVEEKDKQLKEVLEYDLMKTEFFSNISHELRTPINVIYSALQNVNYFMEDIETENRTEKDKVQKYIATMKQNCHRLIRLINNFLDITRFDSGYEELELQNYNIVECVENITLSVVDYIESTGVEIIFDTNQEEKIIAIDPLQIERVILNLLSNAVKFTKSGGRITVTIYIEENNVEIFIKDTGMGIPEEKLGNVFERFVQADKSFTREKEGSGIGLSLVKAIVESHGGAITVNSKVDYGTEFIINLPVRLLSDDNSMEMKIKNNSSIRDENNYIEKVSIEFSDIYL